MREKLNCFSITIASRQKLYLKLQVIGKSKAVTQKRMPLTNKKKKSHNGLYFTSSVFSETSFKKNN